MKRTALAALALPFLLPVAPAYAGGGCYDDGPVTERATTTVTIDHACFGPGAAIVAVGATVTWRNNSGLDHNISGPGMQYADLADGTTYTATFTQAGLYPYACTIHPGMSGVVVVGAVPTAAPAAPAAAVTPVSPASSHPGTPRGLWFGLGAIVVVVVLAALRVVRPRRLVEERA